MQVTQTKYPKFTVGFLSAAVIALSFGLYKASSPGLAVKTVDKPVSVESSVKADDVSSVYARAIENLSKYPELSGKTKFSPMPMTQVELVQRSVGTGLFPVYVDNVIYITDSTGSSLIQPSGAFFLGDKGIKPFTAAIADVVFDSVGLDKFPSHSLPEGVKKTGDMFVLTDPTCGYCRKVDEEVNEYLNAGVVVHYVPYPRAGLSVDNPGFTQWASATCSSQSKQEQATAYYDIILQQNLGKYAAAADLTADCAKIIQEGFLLGRQIGVTGTPFIYTKLVSGESFTQPGYNKVSAMLAMMGVKAPVAVSAETKPEHKPVSNETQVDAASAVQ